MDRRQTPVCRASACATPAHDAPALPDPHVPRPAPSAPASPPMACRAPARQPVPHRRRERHRRRRRLQRGGLDRHQHVCLVRQAVHHVGVEARRPRQHRPERQGGRRAARRAGQQRDARGPATLRHGRTRPAPPPPPAMPSPAAARAPGRWPGRRTPTRWEAAVATVPTPGRPHRTLARRPARTPAPRTPRRRIAPGRRRRPRHGLRSSRQGSHPPEQLRLLGRELLLRERPRRAQPRQPLDRR